MTTDGLVPFHERRILALKSRQFSCPTCGESVLVQDDHTIPDHRDYQGTCPASGLLAPPKTSDYWARTATI